MTYQSIPARDQGAQFEVVERRVYGNPRESANARAAGIVVQLDSLGLLVGSQMGLRDRRGDYAIVQFRKPVGVHVHGAHPVGTADWSTVVVRPPRAALAISDRSARPAPATRSRWLKPAVVVAAIIAAIAVVGYLVGRVMDAASGVDKKMVVGFLVIAAVLGVLAWIRSGGGGSGGNGDGMGFHYGPCPK